MGNIDLDPLFVDPDGTDDVLGTVDDNLRLSIGSPCVNTGRPYLEHIDIPPDWLDMDGNARIINTRVDMGVYEFNIIFVDESAQGDGTGTTWPNAYTELQAPIWNADRGAEIWVASGTYTPFVGGVGDLRERSIDLESGVGLYGGFAGWETDRGERNPAQNTTTLSGDIEGDDVADLAAFLACFSGDGVPFADGCEAFDLDEDGDVDEEDCNIDDNNYHVVTADDVDAAAVLDGFVITAGNANGAYPESSGGGMLIVDGSATVHNCIFTCNRADNSGGAVFAPGGSPVFESCAFNQNVADGCGAGVYLEGGSPTLTSCTFAGNSSASVGGGIYQNQGSLTLDNCDFTGNIASFRGGGLWCSSGMRGIANSAFTGNEAGSEGGAIYDTDCVSTVTDCTFAENTALLGGAVQTLGDVPGGDLALTNCTFSDNSAQSGGAILNEGATVTLTNCTLSGNIASELGGGISTLPGADLTATNCILWENSDSGGTDESAQIYFQHPPPAVAYSCIQDDDPDDTYIPFGGPLYNNIDDDPQFLDPDGEDADLHIYASSPCIEVGDNSILTVDTDLDGNPRRHDADGDEELPGQFDTVDMGAYEYDCVVVEVPTEPSGEAAYAKNRYISFVPGNPGKQTALRVTLTATDIEEPGFEEAVGRQWWIGSPNEVSENAGKVDPLEAPGWPTFWAATLDCEPCYLDWEATLGTGAALHVFSSRVVPASTYEIQAIHLDCDPADESDFSAPLVVTTSIWGDVAGGPPVPGSPWPPPDRSIDIVYDVTPVLDKFKNLAGSPIKARCDIEPQVVDQLVRILNDVLYVYEAFQGAEYPFEAPSACP